MIVSRTLSLYQAQASTDLIIAGMQARPQFINSVDPAQQAILSTASGFTDSFPDTQHHVFGDDQLPQAARSHGPMNEDVIFHSESEQRGDEGQASEDTPSCSRLDRPDSTTLDLELERKWHLSEPQA
jgi:hypothetical protein